VDVDNQNDFINAVLEIKTTLDPHQLLDVLQKIENAMGRKRTIKSGPRIIDLDILFYGQKVLQDENLVIPHPEAHKRRFVLEPMSEIASYFIHPSFGVSIRGLNERLTDIKKVEKIRE
jgi:2-amino-4-hydroxy-6-hydroxymethyldihydropteridine diphosphokinase